MSRQTRRTISLSGRTYAALRVHCADEKQSISDLLEQLVDSHLRALGLSATALAGRIAEVAGTRNGWKSYRRTDPAVEAALRPERKASAAAKAIAKKRRATTGMEPGPAPSPELRFAAVPLRRAATPAPPPTSDVSIMPGRDGVSTRAPRRVSVELAADLRRAGNEMLGVATAALAAIRAAGGSVG